MCPSRSRTMFLVVSLTFQKLVDHWLGVAPSPSDCVLIGRDQEAVVKASIARSLVVAFLTRVLRLWRAPRDGLPDGFDPLAKARGRQLNGTASSTGHFTHPFSHPSTNASIEPHM